MSEFFAYLQLGFQHIADITAYDHIVFIIALCAVYQPQEWKKILILTTAFTIGHSTTLALAVLNIVHLPEKLIEFLIPCTILFTAFFNVFQKETPEKARNINWNYGLAFFFGLIHGLGFSNYLRMLLGKEESILQQLFAFNVGLEIGQIEIVVIIFCVMAVFLKLLKVKHYDWKLFVSGAAAGMALMLMEKVINN
jgi:uncharacterized membrane protein YfcA